MREAIRGYTDAVLEEAAGAGRLGAVAEGAAALGELLGSSEELRDVLSDQGVPTQVRRAVLADLLRDRVERDVVRLVLHAVEHDRASELSGDVLWVAARAAAVRDSRRESGPTTLGRHAALERSAGYATAVLEGLGVDTLSEVEDQLFRFERAIDASAELAAALTSRELPAEVRSGVVSDLLADRALEPTSRLATYLTRIGRPRDYVELLRALVERVGEEADRRVAVVRCAVALSSDQEARLAAALSPAGGPPVDVRVIVDPSVLGGFVATIGDTVVDASVRHRLDLLRERLTLPEATTN